MHTKGLNLIHNSVQMVYEFCPFHSTLLLPILLSSLSFLLLWMINLLLRERREGRGEREGGDGIAPPSLFLSLHKHTRVCKCLSSQTTLSAAASEVSSFCP